MRNGQRLNPLPMTPEDIRQKADEVSALMRAQLGLHGADLARQVARAGRMMPRALRREARYLAQTAAMAENPKLVRMVDFARVSRAHGQVSAFLNGQDPRQRRANAVIGVVGVIAFNLLVVAMILIGWLAWRSPG